MTYDDVIKRAENFGSGLISMGLSPGVHTMVGILNSLEMTARRRLFLHLLTPLQRFVFPD